MLLSCLFILLGLVLLVYGADVFVEGAANIARLLGMSSLMIGLTVVGFATSAPEMIVGSIAAWNGKPAIAIGNALGSNITNISLVLAVSILIIPISIADLSGYFDGLDSMDSEACICKGSAAAGIRERVY